MTQTYDVAVVGAGPAGSSAAALFARQGFHVTLLDRAHFPRAKACAEYMNPGVWQALRELELTPRLPEGSTEPVGGMDICSPGGKRMRVEYSASGAGHAWTVPRTVFDGALLDVARHSGVEVRSGFVARRPVLEGDTVTGVAGTVEGVQCEIRSRLTIVADGTRSTLAHALGLTRPPRWPVRMGLVAYYRRGMNRFQVGEMHAAPGGYCGVAPLCGDRLNVSTVVRTDVLRESKLTATQFFERWIEEHPALRDSLEGAERVSPVRGVSPIGSRVRQSWHPGALLVGDAAGFFDPFTGEGIYRAIRGAALVSAVGAAALHKRDTTSRTLAVYENQRRSSFLAKQAVTALVQVFVQYPFLMEYSLPRLGGRSRTHGILCSALGDVGDAAAFLRPAVLLDALRP